MKKLLVVSFMFAVAFLSGALATKVSAADLPQEAPGSVYRFWNNDLQKHVMTIDYTEANGLNLNNPAWKYDGVVFEAYLYNKNTQTCTEGAPVYRFIGQNYAFFYAFEEEKNALMSNPFWTLEGVVFCAKDKDNTDAGTIKAYRYYYAAQTTHVFTADATEKSAIDANPAWTSEGIAFTVKPSAVSEKQAFVAELSMALSTASNELGEPPVNATLAEVISYYNDVEDILNGLITEVEAIEAPEGGEPVKESAIEVLELTLEYVEAVQSVLNDDVLTDEEKTNEIIDLIDTYLPQLEAALDSFFEELAAYTGSQWVQETIRK